MPDREERDEEGAQQGGEGERAKRASFEEDENTIHYRTNIIPLNSSAQRKGQVRTITTKERVDSFFWFFTPPKMPDVDEDMEEEEAEAMEEAFDMDYDVAQAFRTHLCRDAILWFTGEAANDEEEDSDEEGEEDEEEEEEDEGGAEEDGEGDKVGPAKPLFPTSAAPEGEQPECKNS